MLMPPAENDFNLVDPTENKEMEMIRIIQLPAEEMERELFPNGCEKTISNDEDGYTAYYKGEDKAVTQSNESRVIDTSDRKIIYEPGAPIVFLNGKKEGQPSIELYDNTKLIAQGHVTFINGKKEQFALFPAVEGNDDLVIQQKNRDGNVNIRFKGASKHRNSIRYYESDNIDGGIIVTNEGKGVDVEN